MKRLIKLFLCLIVLSSLCCILFVGCSSSYTRGLIFDYNNIDKTYAVSNMKMGSVTDIVIPTKFRSRKVVAINSYAFQGCETLTSVTIPNGIKSIGEEAFETCISLTSINIPESVTDISGSVFYGCTGLTNITVSANNPKYHSDGNCIIETETKTLVVGCQNSVIPNDGSVTSIGDWAFGGYTDLTTLTIPDSVTKIGSSTFKGCTALTNLVLPKNLTSIGNSTFADCSSLANISIPDSVTAIGTSVFEGCAAFTNIEIPNKIANISNSAFKGCTSLTSVSIPDSVVNIGSNAFDGCVALTSIVIPDSVTKIGNGAFRNCSLKNATIPALAISAVKSKTLETVVLTSGDSIGNSAFSGCTALTSVTIPNSIVNVGNGAFNGCTALEYNENDNALYLGNESNPHLVLVKAKNTEIDSCNIDENTRIICDSAFEDCNKLTSIVIPKNIVYVGDNAFKNCADLTINCVRGLNQNEWSKNWNSSNCPVVWESNAEE